MPKFYLKELQDSLARFAASVPAGTPSVPQIHFAVQVPDPNPRGTIPMRPTISRNAIATWDGKEWIIEL